MYLTGIGDEAGASLLAQIQAHQALSWRQIELRAVQVGEFPGGNIHDIPDRAFDEAVQLLEKHEMGVACFASTIANATRDVSNAQEDSLEAAKRAVPRMKRLGTTLVRIMSYGIGADDLHETKRFHKLKEICRLFNDNGITPVHENCCNYGGMGWSYSLRLLENVPDLKLLFDTGNPPRDIDYNPGPNSASSRQSSWEFYNQVKDCIVHVHIKDAVWDEDAQNIRYTWPGEGQGDVRRIVADLQSRSYSGALSIEPHMIGVFRNGTMESGAPDRVASYIEYGQRLKALVGSCLTENP